MFFVLAAFATAFDRPVFLEIIPNWHMAIVFSLWLDG
jgi:hypothetical protein